MFQTLHLVKSPHAEKRVFVEVRFNGNGVAAFYTNALGGNAKNLL